MVSTKGILKRISVFMSYILVSFQKIQTKHGLILGVYENEDSDAVELTNTGKLIDDRNGEKLSQNLLMYAKHFAYIVYHILLYAY